MIETSRIGTVYSAGLTISSERGEVRAGENSVRIAPVNMKLLTVLLNSADDVVGREFLFEAVWPNQLVSDETLTKAVSDIRIALGKLSADVKFIHTVPKKGYQWLPEVSNTPPESTRSDTSVQEESKQRSGLAKWSVFLRPTLILFFAVLLVFAVTAAFVSGWRDQTTRVAMLPLHAESNSQRLAAIRVEDRLRTQLLSAEGLSVLSRAAVTDLPRNPFTYLRSEFSVDWIVEGRVRSLGEELRVSISVVDAETALVLFTRIEEVPDSPEQMQHFADRCAASISELLEKD